MTNVRLNFGGLPRFEAAVLASLESGVQGASETLAGAMKRGMSKGQRHTSSTPGTPPNVQTGRLRNSIAVQKVGSLRRHVGTNVPYGKIQEFGGTITARGGALAVPIGPQGQKALRDSGGNIRSLNLWTLKRKGKPPLLVQINHKRLGRNKGGATYDGHMTPLFVLKKSVTLPARPWARPALALSRPAMGRSFIRYAKADLARRVGVRA